MKKIKINTQYEARLDSYISDELNGKLSRNEIMKRLLQKNIETRPFFLSMNKL